LPALGISQDDGVSANYDQAVLACPPLPVSHLAQTLGSIQTGCLRYFGKLFALVDETHSCTLLRRIEGLDGASDLSGHVFPFS
jgi:hypothetical protein